MARSYKIPSPTTVANVINGVTLGKQLRGGVSFPTYTPGPTPRQMIASAPGKRVRVRNPTGAQGYKGTG